MKRILALSAIVALASCAGPRQISDEESCMSYGAEPGSSAYFQCRMMKDQQRQANNAALAGIILSRPQPQPYMLPMPK